MPTPAQTALLLGLLVVAAVHTRSRMAGAIAATLWVSLALVWGAFAFEDRDSLRFLGIEAPAWVFFAFFGGLFVFNVTVLARALRRRRAPPPPTSPSPGSGAGTGPSPAGS
jgi:hypothetical protein